MDLRGWLVVATVAGALIAGYGLLAAHLHGKAAPVREHKRIDDAEKLRVVEQAEIDARTSDDLASLEATLAIQERSEARYAAKGLIRATYDNLPRLGALEARRVALLNHSPERLRDFGGRPRDVDGGVDMVAVPQLAGTPSSDRQPRTCFQNFVPGAQWNIPVLRIS